MDDVTVAAWAPPAAPARREAAEAAEAATDPAQLAWTWGDDGCAVVRAGAVTAANPAFADLVGRPARTLPGLELGDLFAPDDLDAALAQEGAGRWHPVAGLLPDGVPFLADVSVIPTDGDRALLRARARRPVVVARPVDPPGDRDEVAHALSHDVRGRLGVASGFLDLLAEPTGLPVDADRARFLDRVASATRVTDRMLERLVAHLRLADAAFHLRPTPLGPVVEAAAARVGVEVTSPCAPLPTVHAEADSLRECLREILANAVEFAHPDRELEVSVHARRVGRWCELHVADNGRGIDPDLRAASLEVFRQLQPRDWERGLGMGLAICRRIVDGHGGAISVRGHDGPGTTIVVRLAPAPGAT